MTSERQRAEYLAKGKEAEERAAKANDSVARDSWLRIAKNYRELAEHRIYPS